MPLEKASSIEEAVALSKEKMKGRSSTAIQRMACIYDDCSYQTYLSPGCYAHFSLYKTKQLAAFLSTATHTVAKRKVAHQSIPYLTWILNDSPWADSHLEKDPEKVIADGMVHNIDWPVEYVVQGGILVRNIIELPVLTKSIEMLYDITQNWLVSCLLGRYLNKTGGYWEFNTYHAVHSIFYAKGTPITALTNILNNNRTHFPTDTLRQGRYTWDRFNVIWGDDRPAYYYTNQPEPPTLKYPGYKISLNGWSTTSMSGCRDDQIEEIIQFMLNQFQTDKASG